MSINRGSSLHGPGPVLCKVDPEKSFRGNFPGSMWQSWGARDSSFILSPQLSIMCCTQRRMCNLFFFKSVLFVAQRTQILFIYSLYASFQMGRVCVYLYGIFSLRTFVRTENEIHVKVTNFKQSWRSAPIFISHLILLTNPEVKCSVKNFSPYSEVSKAFEV